MRSVVGFWICMLACLAWSGCAGDAGNSAGTKSDAPDAGGNTGDGGGQADVAAVDLGKKYPGPCSTTLIYNGKTFPDYARYKYDNKGRKVDEHTWADADKHTWKHTWSYNSKGQVVAEFFETSGAAPNFDYKMTYSGDGKLTNKKGSTSSYKEMDCIYEYGAAGGKMSLEVCTRTWELFNDDREVTGTETDKYMISYTHGTYMITEEYGPLHFSSPDKTIWRTLDDKGRVIKMEIDWSTRGYAEERTLYTWDDNGNLVKEAWDSDADDKPESELIHTWDSYGNLLRSKFTHGEKFPAANTDPKDPKSKPHELIQVYECKPTK